MKTNIQPFTDSTIHFPGGEGHIPEGVHLDGVRYALLKGANADELILTLMWGRAVRQDGGIPWLIIPYLPGARADKTPRQEQ